MIHDLSDVENPRLLSRFDPHPLPGGIPYHTMYLGMLDRGFVIGNPEPLNPDCNEPWFSTWVIDVTDEENPRALSSLPRPKPPPEAPYFDFCCKRGRFGPHNPPHLKAPGRPSGNFVAYSFFIAGVQCFDLTDPEAPRQVAYFIPPQGGSLEDFNSYNRTVDNVFIEWDRKLIYAATDTGLYVLTTPALGEPILGPMRVREWSLSGLNEGHDVADDASSASHSPSVAWASDGVRPV